MDKKLEYIRDLPGDIRNALGTHRKHTGKEWQVCLKVLDMFESDCQTIIKIFDDFWNDCQCCDEATKAAYLKEKMIQTWPDFMTNGDRQAHVTWLMDNLMNKGHRIVAPQNQPYIPSYCMLISDNSLEDMFDLWVADDPDALYEAICQKFKYQE